MNLYPFGNAGVLQNRLIKTIVLSVALVAMIGGLFLVAGPTASQASTTAMPANTSGLSASEVYYAQKGQEYIEAQRAYAATLVHQTPANEGIF